VAGFGSLGFGTVSLCPIACVSTTLCSTEADGGSGLLAFDPGDPVVTPLAEPPGGVELDGPIACPRVSLCVTFAAARSGVGVLVYDPASPSDVRVKGSLGISAVSGVSCPSISLCVDVGADRDGAFVGAGGAQSFDPTAASIRAPAFGPAITGGFSAVSCPSTAQCTVVAGGGVLTYDPETYEAQGARTAVLDAVDGALTISALDCLTTSLCVAVDQTGGVVSFDPNRPGTPTRVVIDPGQALTGLACPDAASCTAVDDGGEVTFDAAAPAPGQRVGLSTGALYGVACPSISLCSATGDFATEFSFDPASGVRARSGRLTDQIEIPDGGLVCPTAAECVTTLQNTGPSSELTFDPASPRDDSTQILDPENMGAGELACPTATQCTTQGPDYFTFDPVHAAAAPITRSTNQFPSQGLACPSVTQCTAVSSNQEQTFNPAPAPGMPRSLSIDPTTTPARSPARRCHAAH
jgi:hypothetical protein